MHNKHFTLVVILIVVALFVGFFAGDYYKGSQTKASSTAFQTGASGASGFRSRAGALGAGAIVGTIISKDSQSITLSLQNGGSQIIFVSPSTNITESVAGSLDNLATGTNVMVIGTSNTDGSETANQVMVRNNQSSTSTSTSSQ